MEISILKEFVCLTTYLNFSEAAFVLHVSQPTLSRHIASLEYELNTTLFTRNKSTGSLTLTYAGETFLSDAKQIISLYNSAVKRISGVNAGFKKSLTIGYRRLYHSDDWNRIFRGFRSGHSDIQIQFVSYSDFAALSKDLYSGIIDLSISAEVSNCNQKIQTRAFFTSSSLGCAININHPLAEQQSVSFADLDETDILLPTPDFNICFYGKLQERFEKEDIHPIVYSHASRMDDADMLVKLDVAINIVPECYYISNSDQICFRPLEDTEGIFPIYCYMRRDCANPAARELFRFIREYHQT